MSEYLSTLKVCLKAAIYAHSALVIYEGAAGRWDVDPITLFIISSPYVSHLGLRQTVI